MEPSTTGLKKQVWKVKTTRKIKHFLWQALSGCVATTSRLADRHCGTDRRCPRCGAEDESINHVLFECPPARQCWALATLPSPPGIFPCSSLYTNMDYLLWRAKEGGAQQESIFIFPWLVWYIWKARNEKVFNNKDISPIDTVKLAEHEAENWRIAQVIEESMDMVEEQEIEIDQGQARHESNTAPEVLCCQVDASWGDGANLVGFGFVASQGTNMVLVGLGARANTRSPLHVELEGLVWAMQQMRERGERNITFESDCAQLIRIINDNEEWPSIDTELEEFYEVYQHFHKVEFLYVPRTENIRLIFWQKHLDAELHPSPMSTG